MNHFFVAAGAILGLAFLAHFLSGDKEFRELDPRAANTHGARPSARTFGIWLMGRGAFQMVSADLLLGAAAALSLGLRLIPFNYHLALLLALLQAGYMLFWLFALLLSKAGRANYLRQGQWLIFLVVLVLLLLALRAEGA